MGTGSLAGAQSGSMSALPDSRRNAEFGSRQSLPADSGAYRSGPGVMDCGDDRKSNSNRSALRNSSPNREYGSKYDTTATSGNRTAGGKAKKAESHSSNTSDSDD